MTTEVRITFDRGTHEFAWRDGLWFYDGDDLAQRTSRLVRLNEEFSVKQWSSAMQYPPHVIMPQLAADIMEGGDLDLIVISEDPLPDEFDEQEVGFVKHLSGLHDQSSHGNWAHGGSGDVGGWAGSMYDTDPKAARKKARNILEQVAQGKMDSAYAVSQLQGLGVPDKYIEQALGGGKLPATKPGASLNSKEYWASAAGDPSAQKAHISRILSEETGAERAYTSELIHAWAATSNSGYESLAVQQLVAEKYGVELSSWQKEQLERYTGLRSVAAQRSREHVEAYFAECQRLGLDPWDSHSGGLLSADAIHPPSAPRMLSGQPGLMTAAESIAVEYVLRAGRTSTLTRDQAREEYLSFISSAVLTPEYRGEALTHFNQLLVSSGSRTDVFVGFSRLASPAAALAMLDNEPAMRASTITAMWNSTQRSFGSANTVTLYRGVKTRSVIAEVVDGSTVKVHQNALSSWTTSRGVANRSHFSGGGFIMKATFPRERIFSSALTGFGCLDEKEFLVLGTVGVDEVTVYKNK